MVFRRLRFNILTVEFRQGSEDAYSCLFLCACVHIDLDVDVDVDVDVDIPFLSLSVNSQW